MLRRSTARPRCTGRCTGTISETADLLIRAGAKVDVANRHGTTPLAMASLYGNTAMVKRLLEAGADAKQAGPNGETTVMLAARNGNPDVIALLAAAGADVNAKEKIRGTTALMWAAEQKHPLAVKALLDRGADVAAESGPAGLPRNYIANYVNTRAVEAAAAAPPCCRRRRTQLPGAARARAQAGGRGTRPGTCAWRRRRALLRPLRPPRNRRRR